MITIALPKGRLAAQVFELMEQAGYTIQLSDNKRKLVVNDTDNGFRYLFVKPSDVITYVEEGVADLGVVGKDSIFEERRDIYQLLDLGIGACKMVVAGPENISLSNRNTLRVATKYPATARDYLADRFPNLHIVYLRGSVELGPLVGLSDVIVDIFETGNTLKANGLVVKEELFDISSYLIANKASYRLYYNKIKAFEQTLLKGAK
jgi:ATP phosphoribosyltransferase